jgi:beta-galactosidase
MKIKLISIFLIFRIVSSALQAQETRTLVLLDKGWKFIKADIPLAHQPGFDDGNWERVEVPHDWAIYGPFDVKNDLHDVAIEQNLEDRAYKQTGRTGGLPYLGVGWYRRTFNVADFDKEKNQVSMLFDGAMSEARVYVNGKEACFWPNGYNSFHFDITEFLNLNGKNNQLAIRLENPEQSSRWYPGAGIYRNVHLIVTSKIHVPVWGTYITTPFVSEEFASVNLKTTLENVPDGQEIRVHTIIIDEKENQVAMKDNVQKINHNMPFEQNFLVDSPKLWSPETPVLYKAVSKIYVENELTDEYTTRFGIRDIKFIADKGFFLNGQHRKFQGVCNHHDLGPLGAAVNIAALRRQLTILKDMGCDAIRTAHNMPAPDLVELCDEMGFMMMVEPFDEWDIAKVKNGYHRFFDEWAERDMVNMVRNYRNNPCVVMWSIGNEVPTQCSPEGYKVAKFLQDICHREDPTRPVTCGMDQVSCVLENGFAAMIDIPGFNYRVHRYHEAYEKLPQNLILGAETASTISSRGVYKFPVKIDDRPRYDDQQISSYDLEYCIWSNLPDEDFALANDYDWTIGQFVWTGFDYLGEPTPYSWDGWPNHSSMFGIIDLASIPKDRFYLYRSLWNKNDETLHILPHWNWDGAGVDTVPVFVYTNYPEAELFVNGKSYGRQKKNNTTLQQRYRLMWMDVLYEPGQVKVVAYNEKGEAKKEATVKTAGKPHRIELISDREAIDADGKDLAYINVRVVDKDGNLCPVDQRLIEFSVSGNGRYKASANGDPTCLYMFHEPRMPLFNGQATVIVQSSDAIGKILLTAKGNGVLNGTIEIATK